MRFAGSTDFRMAPPRFSAMEIAFKKLVDEAVVPTYARDGDAGADLVAAENVTLMAAGGRALVATGVAISLPDGLAAFVQPRSGLALRHGVTVLNSPGLIDSGYRGELKVLLVNTDRHEDFEVNAGERIAQLVIQQVVSAQFIEVVELPDSARGEGGFGSTGRN
jgi:dUTP pyrophosphatase